MKPLEVIDKLEAIVSGDSKYYFEKLRHYYYGCMTASKFKEGDVVKLSKTPIINNENAPGWMSAKHFLIKGAIVTIRTIDYYHINDGDSHKGGYYRYGISFEDESYVTTKELIKTPHHHLFFLKEESLEHIPNGN